MRSRDIYTGVEERHFSGLYVLRNRETGDLKTVIVVKNDMISEVLCLFETPPDAEEYLYNWINEPGAWVVEVADRRVPDEWLDQSSRVIFLGSRVTINPPLDDREIFDFDANWLASAYEEDPQGTLAICASFRRRETFNEGQ